MNNVPWTRCNGDFGDLILPLIPIPNDTNYDALNPHTLGTFLFRKAVCDFGIFLEVIVCIRCRRHASGNLDISIGWAISSNSIIELALAFLFAYGYRW